jgi:hypothetical protein
MLVRCKLNTQLCEAARIKKAWWQQTEVGAVERTTMPTVAQIHNKCCSAVNLLRLLLLCVC